MQDLELDEWDVADVPSNGDVFLSRTSRRWCVQGEDGLIVVVEIESADHVTVVTAHRP